MRFDGPTIITKQPSFAAQQAYPLPSRVASNEYVAKPLIQWGQLFGMIFAVIVAGGGAGFVIAMRTPEGHTTNVTSMPANTASTITTPSAHASNCVQTTIIRTIGSATSVTTSCEPLVQEHALDRPQDRVQAQSQIPAVQERVLNPPQNRARNTLAMD